MGLQGEIYHFFPWKTPSFMIFSRSPTYSLLILLKNSCKNNLNSDFFDSTHIINFTELQVSFSLNHTFPLIAWLSNKNWNLPLSPLRAWFHLYYNTED